jgi:hypothetical protein
MVNYGIEVRSELCVAEHEQGLAFLDLESGCLYVCNDTGAQIWVGLSQKRTFSEVSTQIAAKYLVSRETALEDIDAFVIELERRGWIRRRTS